MERNYYNLYRPVEDDTGTDSGSPLGSVASLENAAGPDFAEFARHLSYEKRNDDSAPYDFDGNTGEMKPPTNSKDVTSLFLIDSKNRDKHAFPQPTNFTLKPPRVYRNVTSIQVVQIKFLTSFFYFRADKGNIVLPLNEIGRLKINQYLDYPLTSAITIREGSYSIGDLLAELQIQMNRTPLFYDFPNGFTDFANNFTINGDLSINFNQPGDSYYDRLNSKYVANPTVSIINGYYWGARYAGLLQYSIDQVKIAYYYPVLYEAVLDTTDTIAYPRMNLNVPASMLSAGETAYSHIVFNSSGLNDPVILYIINENLLLLDAYRLHNTFRYSPVNRYQLAYDTNNLRVNITSLSLNTSLVNLINEVAARNLATALDILKITATEYSNINTILNRARVVYSDMYNFIQTQLSTYFAIPFARYASQYFNTLSNTLYIQNGLDATGVRLGYTSDYLTSGEIPISSMVNTYTSSPGYWPNFNPANTQNGTFGGGFSYSNINPSTSMIPYNVFSKNYNFGKTAIDPSTYYIKTNRSSKSVNIILNIEPSKYTVLKFRSSARQTLQVETLPLPYYYRFSEYNKQGLYKGVLDPSKNNVPQNYFDLSHSYVYNEINRHMDNSKYLTTPLPNIFGQDYITSFIQSETISLNSQNNYNEFEFTAPYPPGITTGLVSYPLNIAFVSMLNDSVSTMFSDTFNAYLYHDRAAFMADLQMTRKENPYHYIASQSVSTTKSDITFNLSTFAGHTYYAIFRSDSLSCSNIQMKPFVYYSSRSNYTQVQTDYVNFSPTGNPSDASNVTNYPFVVNYNTDYIRFPVRSTLQGIDPSNSSFKLSVNIGGRPIGYDISGVSNDLTDYIGYSTNKGGFVPGAPYSIDPISYYAFQNVSPFNFTLKTYFGLNSQNKILYPITNNPYVYQGTSSSQSKIVHYYDEFTIPAQIDDNFTTLNVISTASRSSISTYLPGFPTNSNGDIQFGRGIHAIGFSPTDGVYSVNSFSFKSSIYPKTGTYLSSEDPNSQIQYVGVFSGTYLSGNIINLSSALTVLKLANASVYGPSSLVNTPGFGSELGTWYEYKYDPFFVADSKVNIVGYTPEPTDLLDHTSMYYMVPFNAMGSNMTFSHLVGSLLPYPLSQTLSTGTSYYGQTIAPSIGTQPQPVYCIPSTIGNANPIYGPANGYSITQSQYQQSMPITTPSIGYREYGYLVANSNALFPFSCQFYNSGGVIAKNTMGLTPYLAEYNKTLYLGNSLTNGSQLSNAGRSFSGGSYASSIRNFISLNQIGTLSSITYLLSTPSTLQNYSFTGGVNHFSSFLFQAGSGNDSNVSVQSFQVQASMNNLTFWLWGGGGGTLNNQASVSGGAGAYIKASINATTLLNTATPDCPGGVSTLYIVVGKGGNRDNTTFIPTTGIYHGYGEPRYGGGGTSILANPDLPDDSVTNEISLQGGGFSGIFTGSNLMTATPLLIVGGGGASGTANFGGPGGIGLVPDPLPVIQCSFSSVTSSAIYYGAATVTSLVDLDSNAVINGSNISNAFDGSIVTFWDPSPIPYMNQNNYNPTPNTYRVQVNYSGTQSPLKIRYYGAKVADSQHLPTGFVVYANVNKAEMLYSNTSIQVDDYQGLENGAFNQSIYEIVPTVQASTIPFTRNAWIVGGSNTTTQNALQYSVDGLTWTPITTNTSLIQNVVSVLYVSAVSAWYAGGSGGILKSQDGLNWSLNYTASFTVNSLATATVGTLTYIVAAVSNGDLLVSINGSQWAPTANKFTSSATKIRYINGYFWALSDSETSIKRSVDGFNWITLGSIGTVGACDISYGVGRYVITQSNNQPPFNSTLIFSPDGLSWSVTSQLNLDGFRAKSVAFGNGVFVAVGSTTDGTSFIKYSNDGINWSNSSFPALGDSGRNEIQFLNGSFLCVGAATQGSNKASNQPSILSSVDGKIWVYSQIGGFNPDQGSSYAMCSSYGPITIQPSLSSVYIEIQNILNTSYEPLVYEIRPYTTSNVLTTPTSTLIDTNFQTVFTPTDAEGRDVFQYPFTLTFSNSPVSSINTFQIYSPTDTTGLFTDLTVSLNSTREGIVYSSKGIETKDYTLATTAAGIKNLFTVTLSPPITGISTVLLNFTKVTPGPIKINEIQAFNDTNLSMVQYIPLSIKDLESLGSASASQGLSNLTDGTLSKPWYPGSFPPGTTLRLNFTFSTLIDRINTVHIYNDVYGSSEVITGIRVFSDSNKSQVLYSNDSVKPSEYTGYSLFNLPLSFYGSLSTIYMELLKTTLGTPLINEIRFFNTGSLLFTSTIAGYSGGSPNMIQKTLAATSSNDGGGGGVSDPGISGTNGYLGGYLIGGSPAEAGNYSVARSFSSIQGGAGGGGGGYYGGGGGGNESLGGAGGGGAGYVYKPVGFSLLTVLDYGTAVPIEGYNSPRSNESIGLAYSNIIPAGKYGQGGQGLIDLGRGQHGIVVLSYQSNVTVVPPSSGSAIPKYIDGSRISIFEAPLTYNTDLRSLSFSTFMDSTEMSPSYSGLNWVWYRSYLLMTGATLLSTMKASSLVPQVPVTSFPSLPSPVYTTLASEFSNVSTLYGSGKAALTYVTASTITGRIDTAFGMFQSTFVTVPYTAPNYIEMTETYCLLDYLRATSNLVNPHVNQSNSSMDRIFGGVPRFGYWANPFLTNVSYIGFDVGPSLMAPSSLTQISGSSNQVRALYGLVLEQSLSTGVYQMKDIMAYKPTMADATLKGMKWLTVTQFPEAYHVRNLTNFANLNSNIPAQPYTIRNGINGQIPLFNYKVYTTPLLLDGTRIQSPIHMINDFEGTQTFLYSFQNTIAENTSSINLTPISLTSTVLHLNQTIITDQANLPGKPMGTLVTENSGTTLVQVVTQFGYNNTKTVNFTPVISYSSGAGNYYNTYVSNSELAASDVGKAVLDSYGNFYAADNKGSANLYENICSVKIYQKSFLNSNVSYASPKFLLSTYTSGVVNPSYDFLLSKTTNLWHLQGSSNLSTLYGARLTSPYDFNVTTNFANQVFYPTHKIVLNKKSSSANPMTDTTDLTTYPSYNHTQMFFYKDYTSMSNDIQGKFASESKSNFTNMDDTSGYFLHSYISNIALEKSGPIVNDNSFNYLAIRAYSPSESFQTMLRLYLPERYDYGYISLADLSGEISTLKYVTNVNPEYSILLSSFHSSFKISKTFGSIGLPGFSGSNISSLNFGDFLNQYNQINSTINSGSYITSTVNGYLAAGQSNLVLGDLQYILPSFLANRQRVTDPLEFQLPFSTIMSSSNRGIEEYGLGYNLGFDPVDTRFNTIQRAESFFKILDDYVYLQMNPEFNMNRLDISQRENFAETHDTTAQSQMYNCKLILNNFGTYATTFVQNQVVFNPPIGKLDKLSFSWYDITGVLINNTECEWSGGIQIVEKVDVAK